MFTCQMEVWRQIKAVTDHTLGGAILRCYYFADQLDGYLWHGLSSLAVAIALVHAHRRMVQPRRMARAETDGVWSADSGTPVCLLLSPIASD
jgi:hypothetical protein